MKPFFILVSSLISISATLQPPNACYKNKEEAYCFHNNQFSWQRSANNHKEIGNGTYSIKGDSIELNFETAIREFDISINKHPISSPDATVKVSAIRSNGTPIKGLKIILLKSNRLFETDSRGEAEVTISRAVSNDDLFVEHNGQRSPALNLHLAGFQSLLGIVIDEAVTYHENQSVILPYKKAGHKVKINGKSFKKLRAPRKAIDK